MNGETFAVVTTDGREHPAVDMETIKRWYLEKHLSDDSLIFSSEAGDWRLLNGMFDINSWSRKGFSAENRIGSKNEDLLFKTSDNSEHSYFEELTSLAVPPDADFETVQHFTPYNHANISKPVKKGFPGLTALATLAVFGVFGAIAYVVLINFVFYEEIVSFSNNNEIAALKTHVMGTPFSDPSGVKVNLPAGWNMVSAKMPEAKVQAKEAKMFAVNFDKKMFSALEIIPVDEARLDLKAKMSEILQKYRKNSAGPFSVIADYDTQMGSNMARKTIFSRRDRSVDASTTTHLIIAQDKKNLYLYHIWTVTDKYSALLKDFDEAEKALSLP
jgi:hypothetical protein